MPDAETREHLLDTLADLIARGGAARFLLPPISPEKSMFPDTWEPTPSGVRLLLRRLAWHAGLALDPVVIDRRSAAPTDGVARTRIELVELTQTDARFELGCIGDDDLGGTLAHELGVAYAALHRSLGHAPYRSNEPPSIAVDPDADLERGSIAAIYLGLGVVAANASCQQHNVLEPTGFNPMLVASVARFVEAGYVPMTSLTYLLAVQAVVRGDAAPPHGLEPAQKSEVVRWLSALADSRAELRARLGIPDDESPGTRPTPEPFDDPAGEDGPPPATSAFRWRTHRGGIGLIAGTVLGFGVALAVPRAMPWLIFGGAAAGHIAGRRVVVMRCSSCAGVLADSARCRRCGALMRGHIAHLSDRLDAEERLQEASTDRRDGASTR
jgi:hypothetical protein